MHESCSCFSLKCCHDNRFVSAQLEHMRSAMLPAVIKFLQKMWRGAIARQRYKIFYAMFKIVRKFRAWKFKIYLLTLIRRFSHVRDMRDFGKSLEWPEAPFILRKFHVKLYNTFRRWRLRQRLKSISPEEWPEIKCKIAALEVIGSKRHLAVNRRWRGNYLALAEENAQSASFLSQVNNLLSKENSGHVLFSTFIKKLSSRGKTVDRALLFTESHIYKMDKKRDFKCLKVILMENILEVVVTTGNDQLVVLRTNDDYDIALTLENDRLENRVPELIGALRLAGRNRPTGGAYDAGVNSLSELKFTVQNPPISCLVNSTQHLIDVEVHEVPKSKFEESVKEASSKDPALAAIQDSRFRKDSGSKKIIMQCIAPPAVKAAAALVKTASGIDTSSSQLSEFMMAQKNKTEAAKDNIETIIEESTKL